jgi:hypothetical protein
MKRKSDQADAMFAKMVELLNHEIKIEKHKPHTKEATMPDFL